MLTREYILSLEAGREMDALVEKHIFGNEIGWMQEDPVSGQGGYGFVIEHYSTDISAAWEVLEKMRGNGLYIRLADQSSFYKARFCTILGDKTDWVMGDTAPLAICRAALLTTIQGVDKT